MKRILIGTVAMIMALPAFAGGSSGPIFPHVGEDGGYSCTVTYRCGDGTGASRSYTNYDANNKVITVSENTTCSKSGTTFSHWAVTSVGSVTPLSPVAYPGESYDTTGCSNDIGNAFAFTAVYTSDNARTTSKPYVDDQIATRQVKIPAANPSNTNIGNTVITYTNVEGGGVIGERQLFTGADDYDASTDADKLITAAALNNTFTNLPTTDTTKLECANQSGGCTLWTIIDQTAYGAGSGSGGGASAETLAMLQALVGTRGTGYCYKQLSDGTVYAGTCTTTPSNYGDWGTMFTYNNEPVQVSGITVCSSVNEGLSMGGIPTNQTGVQSDYESNMSNAPTSSPVGGYCYCKLTNPSISAARWVYWGSYTVSSCASNCANDCAYFLRSGSGFQSAVFGAN